MGKVPEAGAGADVGRCLALTCIVGRGRRLDTDVDQGWRAMWKRRRRVVMRRGSVVVGWRGERCDAGKAAKG
jgi:hypothetical protein